MKEKPILIVATSVVVVLLIIIPGVLFVKKQTGISRDGNRQTLLKPTEIPVSSESPTPSLTLTPEPFHVTSASVLVDQPIINGACPASFIFTAAISANDAGTVSYQWVRSDGTGSSTPQTITFKGAGEQTVSTTWNLGSAGFSLTDGWEKIQILSPNNLESNQTLVTLHCS